MRTLFVENLTVIDFSYACPLRGIVGASWIVDIELDGILDAQGMIFDFGHVKKIIKTQIDDAYDHKLWLSRDLPNFSKTNTEANPCYQWQSAGADYQHLSPHSAILELDHLANLETMAPIIAHDLKTAVPSNVQDIRVKLREERINGAAYCYTHGLQKHEGNCQRIAHGHKSTIEIYIDEQRKPLLEQQWAQQWHDIYIATDSHIVSQSETQTRIEYTAPQGEFTLTLPSSRVYRIDTESTVENIAAHICQTIAQTHPRKSIKVKAFEGIGKGAIARA